MTKPLALPELHRGVVYFIEADGMIKIGFSTDMYKRLGDLKTGSGMDMALNYYVRADRAFEKELHRILASERIRGEWFRDSDKTNDLIELITDYVEDEFSDLDEQYLDGRDAHVMTIAELHDIIARPYYWRQE